VHAPERSVEHAVPMARQQCLDIACRWSDTYCTAALWLAQLLAGTAGCATKHTPTPEIMFGPTEARTRQTHRPARATGRPALFCTCRCLLLIWLANDDCLDRYVEVMTSVWKTRILH